MRNDTLLTAAFAVAMALAPSATTAASGPGPDNRDEAVEIIRDMRRIVTEHGVERLETVQLGGMKQWISIRGNDRRNPVLLMIHGGPGYPAMPTSWYFQRGWEEYFTVVQWDQRGAGKTYATNDPKDAAETLTRKRVVADAEQLIVWLRHVFDKERVFVLGHSWGTVIGLEIAQRHPEWLHAYIGLGQMINSPESERRGWQFAMESARRDGNEGAVSELEAIAPYAQPGEPLPLKDLYTQRKWLAFYGGVMHGRTSSAVETAAVALSPEYSDRDLRGVWAGNELSEARLLKDALTADFTDVTKIDTPLILFNGRHDHNVAAGIAAEWFERVEAPSKQLVWFENSAHEIMNEEPGKTLVSLVRHALPIAERAGDIAP